MNWINAIGQCTIAGAIATWYWTRDKKALPRSPIWRSFCRTTRYHLGSLALGALIIAIVQFVRFILSQIQARLRGSENRAAQYIMSCLQCCFMCLEKFLKFLNKNAYIMLLITSVVCLIGLAILQSRTSVGDMYGLPLLVIAVLSWSISTAFVSVVQMAVNVSASFVSRGIDGGELGVGWRGGGEVTASCSPVRSSFLCTLAQTIFLCFCEDCERNDGTAARPYFMSDTLKAFTDKHQAPKV
ncbi:MAG: plasma-membrane choline transporter-domain-containing protein [Olpidium bornovanus]|uniref:Protein PNS1 n=1 Tax=Olpidium bornovanus TaxID=278681 RepID=A0A8H7ZUC6_9FUNG|nr:MAG: plasma-membrane choline transporter-domain-containing protein [Olpidium bornovanus]